MKSLPPAAEAGSVLIRVHAAGLNPVDYKVRQDKMRLLNRLHLPPSTPPGNPGTRGGG